MYIFINTTINVSNAMMNLTSLNDRIIMVAVTINAYATIVKATIRRTQYEAIFILCQKL